MKKIVVLISGSGSNLQAIIDSCENGKLKNIAKITQVISNRKTAFGLERASKVNIPTAVLSLKTWQTKNPTKSREDYDQILAKAVIAGGNGKSKEFLESNIEIDSNLPDLIVLAGFMHIVSPTFLNVLGSIPCINLHPALPGQFDGIDAIKRAYNAFQDGTLKDNKTGVMIHKVIAEVDKGEPILVYEIECKQGESLSQLEERIHYTEHKIIVEAIYKLLL